MKIASDKETNKQETLDYWFGCGYNQIVIIKNEL